MNRVLFFLIFTVLSGCATNSTVKPIVALSPPPIVNIAVLYQQGLFFLRQKAFIPAYQRFRQAAEHGHATAQFEVAQLYHEGKGVPRDKTKATYWYRKAAEQGYVKPRPVKKVKIKTVKIVEDVRTVNHTIVEDAEVQFQRARAYSEGKEVPRDTTQAALWYQKAAEQGHIEAQFRLGGLYHFGIGVPQDVEQAKLWYRNAAVQGYADAQLSLGMMYFNELHIPRDLPQAKQWLLLAAEQENEDAIAILNQVNMMLH